MSAKEELEELKSYLKDLPLLAKGDQDARIARALVDFEYFKETYFPHHIDEVEEETSEFRDFVNNNIQDLTDRYKLLEFLAYRGSSKSTTLSRLYILWRIAQASTHYFVELSDTLPIAKDNLGFIKAEIEENKLYKFDFKVRPSKKWSEIEIIIRVGTSHYIKGECAGAGKAIRGKNFMSHRPDLIIVDDIENDENVESKPQRDKLEKWFKKAVMKLPNRKKHYNIIVIGTLLHHDAVLARIGKYKKCKTFSFPLVLAFPTQMEAWEELYSLELDEAIATYEANQAYYDDGAKLDDSEVELFDVMMDYFDDIDSFMSELQNEPISKSKLIFNGYEEYEDMPRCDAYYIGVDPSLGKSKKSDYFALAYLGYVKSTKTFYAKVKGYKIPAIDMIPKILELYARLKTFDRPVTVAIETVAFQDFFKDTVKLYAKSHDIHLPVKEVKSSTAKELRIQSIAPLFRDGTILVDKKDRLLKEELDTYPKAPHDDLLDATEMAYNIYGGISSADYKAFRKAIQNSKFKFLGARNKYE